MTSSFGCGPYLRSWFDCSTQVALHLRRARPGIPQICQVNTGGSQLHDVGGSLRLTYEHRQTLNHSTTGYYSLSITATTKELIVFLQGTNLFCLSVSSSSSPFSLSHRLVLDNIWHLPTNCKYKSGPIPTFWLNVKNAKLMSSKTVKNPTNL